MKASAEAVTATQMNPQTSEVLSQRAHLDRYETGFRDRGCVPSSGNPPFRPPSAKGGEGFPGIVSEKGISRQLFRAYKFAIDEFIAWYCSATPLSSMCWHTKAARF